MSRLSSLGFKIYGEPPPKSAPRSELLRWIRNLYLKPLPLILPVCVLTVVWAPETWVMVLLAVSASIRSFRS